jgi:hypothetical protein
MADDNNGAALRPSFNIAMLATLYELDIFAKDMEIATPLKNALASAQDSDQLAFANLRACHERAQRLTPYLPRDKKYLAMSLSDCNMEDGGVTINDRLNVSVKVRIRVIDEHHITLIAGHSGRTGTYYLVSRSHIRSGMTGDTRRYIRNYHVCCRTEIPWSTRGRERALEGSKWPRLLLVDRLSRYPTRKRETQRHSIHQHRDRHGRIHQARTLHGDVGKATKRS